MTHQRHDYLWAEITSHLPPGELAHDLQHIRRVYRWAIKIAESVNADTDLCGAAAIVHDLVAIPKDHADRSKAGEKSAAASAPILKAAGYSKEDIEVISQAVATSSWSKGCPPKDAVGEVLQDADRLDAIGAIGLARCLCCSQYMALGNLNRTGGIYNPADPLADSVRELEDNRFAVDHFRAKLLKLADGMHSDLAKKEASRRHEFLEKFLDELRMEL